LIWRTVRYSLECASTQHRMKRRLLQLHLYESQASLRCFSVVPGMKGKICAFRLQLKGNRPRRRRRGCVFIAFGLKSDLFKKSD